MTEKFLKSMKHSKPQKPKNSEQIKKNHIQEHHNKIAETKRKKFKSPKKKKAGYNYITLLKKKTNHNEILLKCSKKPNKNNLS